MCGICGFYDTRPDARRHVDELIAMGERMVHRGPDSHGSTLQAGVGLHNRRLKILDLEGGDQPFFSDDEQVALVYNGEVFNFPSLREELEAKGYRFKTHCDTEAILYLYLEHGIEGTLERLNGFFAFAIHDRRRGELWLARDRMGVKPLYYARTQRGLVFGSELKTLLQEGSLSTDLDPTALVDFLALRYVPAPSTIYRDARKLPAGHLLRFDGQRLDVRRWWDLPEFGTRDGDPEALAEELWQRVVDAVDLRLLSDVPLGAFLSGGLDSSGVVTAMQQLRGSDVTAVSVGFENFDLSELDHARRVAGGLGIHHVTDVLKPEVLGLVDRLAWFFDEPFADPSAIPTYLLAERTRREVTVALSGDGGDECWAGYRRYRFDQAENRVRAWLPGPLFRGLFRLAGRLYPKADFLPRPLRFKSTLENLARDPLAGYLRSVSYQPVERARALLHPDLRPAVADYHPRDRFAEHFQRAPARDPLSRVQYLDFQTYLPDYILCKTDRATMAHSLEAREPLLDHRLVEFAATLAPSFKLRRGVAKWLLKRAFEPHLPPATIERPKQGFTPPLRQWVDAELNAHGGELESPPWLDPGAVQSRVRAHRSRLADHSELLYQVLVLRGFARLWESGYRDPSAVPVGAER